MNTDTDSFLSELFKRQSLFLVVLGAILLLVAALGGLPFGNQNLPAMDPILRYILAGIGTILLIIGIVLVWREQSKSFVTSKQYEVADSDLRNETEFILESNSAKQLARSGLTRAFRIPTNNAVRLDRVRELIAQEVENGEKRFRLAASSGHSYLNPNGPVWADAGLGKLITNNNVEIMAVLESPFSDFAKTRAIANGVRHHHWQEKQRPENLIELLRYPNVSICVTDVSVNCSLFFTSYAVYYDPYLWALPGPGSRTENKFWVFEFDCYASDGNGILPRWN